jgi:hypothetical protein
MPVLFACRGGAISSPGLFHPAPTTRKVPFLRGLSPHTRVPANLPTVREREADWVGRGEPFHGRDAPHGRVCYARGGLAPDRAMDAEQRGKSAGEAWPRRTEACTIRSHAFLSSPRSQMML